MELAESVPIVITYRSWIQLFRVCESKFSNRSMLFDETPIELLETDIVMLESLNCFVMKKIAIFSNLTQILESAFASLRCVEGKRQCYRIAGF